VGAIFGAIGFFVLFAINVFHSASSKNAAQDAFGIFLPNYVK